MALTMRNRPIGPGTGKSKSLHVRVRIPKPVSPHADPGMELLRVFPTENSRVLEMNPESDEPASERCQGGAPLKADG